MSDYVVISIDNCPYCEKAKALLTESGFTYAEINCADVPELAIFLKAVDRTTFPLILRSIGGFVELESILK